MLVCFPSFTLKSPPGVNVETCESLNPSLVFLAASDLSECVQYRSLPSEQINALSGVRCSTVRAADACCSSWGFSDENSELKHPKLTKTYLQSHLVSYQVFLTR